MQNGQLHRRVSIFSFYTYTNSNDFVYLTVALVDKDRRPKNAPCPGHACQQSSGPAQSMQDQYYSFLK